MFFVKKKIILVFTLFLSIGMLAQNEEKLPDFFDNSNSTSIEQVQIVNITSKNNFLQPKEFKSDVILKQYGTNNQANISNNTFSNQKIVQYGNKNSFKYKDYYFNNSMNIGVLQIGNKNSLNVFGANSIFRGAKITQTGGAKVTVNNF